MSQIQKNVKKIQDTIQDNSAVTIIAATKYVDVEKMNQLYHAGIRHFGENKIQDALKKMMFFDKNQYQIEWHFIGRLQSNKSKKSC